MTVTEDIFNSVQRSIDGRIAMSVREGAGLIAGIANAGGGDHLDIGTLWGGSAILAARALILGGYAGTVYTLDPMDTAFWQSGDPGVGHRKPTEDIIRKNLTVLGVSDRVRLFKVRSHEWLPDRKRKFATALIDGDHSYAAVKRDLELVAPLVTKLIFLHDFDGCHSIYKDTIVPAVFHFLQEEDDWEFDGLHDTLIVLRRTEDAKSVG